MSDKQIHFELISPEKKLVSEPVYLAEIPGDKGMFGVLSGHSSMLVSLGNGVVRLHKNKDDKDVSRIFISGGFADVTGQSCTVLAEEAVLVSDLDKGALEQTLADLSDDLETAEESADKQRIRNEIVVTKAKLFALGQAA